MQLLNHHFFAQTATDLAQCLLGKIIRHRLYVRRTPYWLAAQIIETEAYEITEKGSHASLGRTPSREALFMPPGSIYMYYARGGDSLNFSAQGDGNAVLVKSAFPYFDHKSPSTTLAVMQMLNPGKQGPRQIGQLCQGQTLLCKSLGLRVPDWNGKTLTATYLRLEDVGYRPHQVIQCARLGIPAGRDEHLLYRFIDGTFAKHCTSNPLMKRNWRVGQDYFIHCH